MIAASKDFPTLARYREVILHNLTETHHCPVDVAQSLLETYREEVQAMYQAGIAAISPARLLYAEWKTFSG